MRGSLISPLRSLPRDFGFRQWLVVIGLSLAIGSLLTLRGIFGLYIAPAGALAFAVVAVICTAPVTTHDDSRALDQIAFAISLVAFFAALIALTATGSP